MIPITKDVAALIGEWAEGVENRSLLHEKFALPKVWDAPAKLDNAGRWSVLRIVTPGISLASSTTTSERMSTIITTTSQTIVPPAIPINKQAIEVIKQGLVKAVEEGTTMAAGTAREHIAGKAGSNEENALCLSFAPAHKPEIGLIIFLKEGTSTEAAQVAGRFYRAYFNK